MQGMQPGMQGMQPGMQGMQPGMQGMQPGMEGSVPAEDEVVHDGAGKVKQKMTGQAWCCFATGFISTLFILVCLFLNQWLYNPPGLFGYMPSRSWGLFKVVGERSQSHMELYYDTQSRSIKYMFAAQCIQPMCKYYWAKSEAWLVMWLASWGTAFFVVISLVCSIGGVAMIMQNSTANFKLGSLLYAGSGVSLLAGVALYFTLTDMAFEDLEIESQYPRPTPSICIFLAIFSGVLQLIGACIAKSTYTKSYRADKGIVDDTESETDSSDEDKRHRAKQTAAYAQGGMGMQGGMQGGMGGVGMGGYPQQGYGQQQQPGAYPSMY